MTANTIIRMKSFSELAILNQLLQDGDVIAIDGIRDESYVVENGQTRRVRACVLPEGYFPKPAPAPVIEETSGSQPVLTNVTLRRALDEGFENETEFAKAQLRGFQQTMRQERAASRPAEAVRKVREFSPSQFVEHPSELVDLVSFRASLRQTMQALVSTADYDPACEIIAIKEYDGMAQQAERHMYGVEQQAEATKKEIARLHRESPDDTEIPIVQIERLEERLRGLRVQYFHFREKHRVALELREQAVGVSGINWPPYVSIKDRAQRGEQEWRAKQRRKTFSSGNVAVMTDAEFREQAKGLRPYQPRNNGVDAAGSERSPGADPTE